MSDRTKVIEAIFLVACALSLLAVIAAIGLTVADHLTPGICWSAAGVGIVVALFCSEWD